jgi:hypothetical protein
MVLTVMLRRCRKVMALSALRTANVVRRNTAAASGMKENLGCHAMDVVTSLCTAMEMAILMRMVLTMASGA